jgi:hypothetical protein
VGCAPFRIPRRGKIVCLLQLHAKFSASIKALPRSSTWIRTTDVIERLT